MPKSRTFLILKHKKSENRNLGKCSYKMSKTTDQTVENSNKNLRHYNMHYCQNVIIQLILPYVKKLCHMPIVDVKILLKFLYICIHAIAQFLRLCQDYNLYF